MPSKHQRYSKIYCVAAIALLGASGALGQSAAPPASSQTEFASLSQQIVASRSQGGEYDQNLLDTALKILDGMVLSALRAPAPADLHSINEKLAALASPERPGGSYVLQQIGGAPPVYVLTANFGVSGPSAARLYARSAADYKLSGRIDRFSQADFFDDYLEVLPVAPQSLVFVTVSGRTDELSSGIFTAWQYTPAGLEKIWASELRTRSSYVMQTGGIDLTYCGESDDDDPSICKLMIRERYTWDGAHWNRSGEPPPPAAK